jgi:hypothetical protein
VNTDQVEANARRSAANLADSLSRAALTAQFADTIAFLAGVEAGLRDGTPADSQIACTVDAQSGVALAAVRLLAARITSSNAYEPLTVASVNDDLVEATGPLYALTAVQVDAIRDAAFRAGQNALVSA